MFCTSSLLYVVSYSPCKYIQLSVDCNCPIKPQGGAMWNTIMGKYHLTIVENSEIYNFCFVFVTLVQNNVG